MPEKRELSPEKIQEIISLRGVEPAAFIRKRFGIGTSRLYRIWKNAEREREAPAAANAAAAAAANAAPANAAAAEAAPANAEENRGLAAVLSELKILQDKMDLLIEGEESHFEDVEDLEEQLDEAQKGILDTIEESSNAIREKTDKFVSASNAAKAAACSLIEALLLVGGILGFVWLCYRIARNPIAQELARKNLARLFPPKKEVPQEPMVPNEAKAAPEAAKAATEAAKAAPAAAKAPARGIRYMEWAPHPTSGKQGQGKLPGPACLLGPNDCRLLSRPWSGGTGEMPAL